MPLITCANCAIRSYTAVKISDWDKYRIACPDCGMFIQVRPAQESWILMHREGLKEKAYPIHTREFHVGRMLPAELKKRRKNYLELPREVNLFPLHFTIRIATDRAEAEVAAGAVFSFSARGRHSTHSGPATVCLQSGDEWLANDDVSFQLNRND